MKKKTIEKFLDPLRSLTNLLNQLNIDGVIIGGIAVSLLGKPRFTADLDAVVLIPVDKLEKFVKRAREYALFPRIKDALSFAHKNRIVLLTHKPTGIDVDISLGILPFEIELVNRARKIKIGGLSFKIPAVEDLIIMKSVSHRKQDLVDIEELIRINPSLDFKRIKRWVKEFSRALKMPEILEDLERLIPQKSKIKRIK